MTVAVEPVSTRLAATGGGGPESPSDQCGSVAHLGPGQLRADPVDGMAGDDEHLGRHVGATGNAAVYHPACLQKTKLRA